MHEASPDLVERLADQVVDTNLLAEVEDLARSISTMRSDLQRLEAGPFVAGHIPMATDELDAVVAHTASATDVILQVCEELEMAGTPDRPADAALLQKATTRIYEACSFQDITGQRISKVVATLKAIEAKVGQILEVFGHNELPTYMPGATNSQTNGPQLPGAAMEQADIDALLADF